MLGIIAILAAAKRLIGVFLKIKNNGPSAETSIGTFDGSQNSITPNEWNHVAMSVANGTATFYVNGQNAGGNLGTVPPVTNYGLAKLYNVNYLRNTSVNINANSYLGANNKTFLDRSPLSSKILTTSGALVASGVTLGSFSPYSNQEWAAQFTSTNYLSVDAVGDQFYFGREDFTIEFWAYVTEAGVVQSLLDLRNNNTNYAAPYIYIGTDNKLRLNLSNVDPIVDVNNFPLNKWCHIALCRKWDSNMSLFLDGTKVGQSTLQYCNTINLHTPNLVLGRHNLNTEDFNGYISNVRIIRGSSIYNSNFTPTSQPLKLLPQKENKSWSGYFPSSNGYLSATDYNIELGLNDYTIDFWCYFNELLYSSNNYLFDFRTSQNAGYGPGKFYCLLTAKKFYINLGAGFDLYANTEPKLNTWHHIRLVRKGVICKLYFDGILENFTSVNDNTFPYHDPNKSRFFGVAGDITLPMKGYITNFRIIKGLAIDQAFFTPPTQKLELVGLSATHYTGFFGTNASCVSSLAPNLGLNNFTIECWANLKDNPVLKGSNYPILFDMRRGGTNGNTPLLYIKTSTHTGAGNLIFNLNGTEVMTSNTRLISGEWYHIAMSRDASVGSTFYVDGYRVGFYDDRSITYSTSSIFIGGASVVNNGGFGGNISNFRVVTGEALYSGSFFERPIGNLSARPGTALLTLQDRTLKDNSPYNRSLDSRSFLIAPHNLFEQTNRDYSLNFNSSLVSYLSSSDLDVSVLNFGKNDYTIELFIKPKLALGSNQYFFDSRRPSDNKGIFIYLDGDYHPVLNYNSNSSTYGVHTERLAANKWHHIAIVRKYGESFKMYVNGIDKFIGSHLNGTLLDTGKYFFNTAINEDVPGGRQLVLGSNFGIAGDGLHGEMSNLRIVNGKALYTNNFTPPTQKLSIIPQEGEDEYSLASGYLSASNFATSAVNIGANSFTLEAFVYFNDNAMGVDSVIYEGRSANLQNAILLSKIPTNFISLTWGGGAVLTTTTAVAANQWYHIALVRSVSSSVTIYIDGINRATTTTGTSVSSSYLDTKNVVVGALWNNTSNMRGYISNLRLINGRALYTSNFIPPTGAPLSAIDGTTLLVCQDNTLIDNASSFAPGTTSVLSAFNAKFSPHSPYRYTGVKTTMLALQDKMTIFKDYSTLNNTLTAYNYVYGSNDNPFNSTDEKTLLLSLNQATTGDESGHISLSAFGTFAMSAVGPQGSPGYSGVFNGTNTYLSGINYAPTFLDDDDFTIEFWFYKTKLGAATLLMTKDDGAQASDNGIWIHIDGENSLYFKNARNQIYENAKIININTWYHVSIIRTNRVITCNLNGEPLYMDSSAGDRNDTYNTLNSKNIAIGANYTTTPINYFPGLISNLRIVKGKNIYQLLDKKHFNLPTEPIKNEIATTSPTSYSHYFDAVATTGVTATRTAEFEFGLNSFTIEYWVLPRARIGNNDRHLSLWSTRAELLVTRGNNQTIYIVRNNVDQLTTGSNRPLLVNEWNHVALVREKGNNMNLYVNGVSSNSVPNTADFLSAGDLGIGCKIGSVAGNNTDGLISNVRITKNAALYSGASFTVPTSPLVSYNSFDLNKYSAVFDTTKNTLVTIPTISSSNFTFGTNSFCVEFFMYAFNQDKLVTIYDTRDLTNLNGNFLRIVRSAANKIVCYVAGVAKITSTANISAGRWYHIAYERKASSNSTLYINGVADGTHADSLSSYNKINYVYLGGSTTTDRYDGCISNLRISNNSIYNNAFTVPQSELTSLASTQLLIFKDSTLADYSSNQLSLCSFPDSNIFSNKFSPFYPSNSGRTILLTLQNNSLVDNAGVFYPNITLNSSGVTATDTNPFNKPQSIVMELFYDKDDYKKYNLSAKHDFGYSLKDPFSDKKDFVTSFLSLNDGRYKDSSIYNAPLYNTTLTQRAIFNNFSPFLNLTPYSSANGGSIYFTNAAGNTKFLLVSSQGSVTNFGSSDFTIEFWIYKNSTAASQMMLFDTMSALSVSSPGHMQIYLDTTNKVVFYAGGAARITSTLGIPTHSWQHIAVARRGLVTSLYINGVANSTSYSELNAGSLSAVYTDPGNIAIGSRLSAVNTNTFEGYITDFHIVSGSCLYISDFSPPIQPLSSFSNTKLLINADNAGIVDSTGKFNLFTGGSGVSISSDAPAISASASTGTLSAGSIYFDGSNNSYVYTDTNNQFFNLSSFYTAELWVKPTVTPSTSAVLFAVRNTDADKLVLAIDNLRRVIYRVNNNAATTNSITAATPLTLNTWSHIALVRDLSGNNYKTTLYVNGVSSGFVTVAIANTAKLLHIGADNNTHRLSGYIDDFRIIKEVRDAYSANVSLPEREGEIHNYLSYPDDPFLSNTSILVKDDPTQSFNNNTLTDESNNALTVNNRGGMQGSVSPFSPGFGYNPGEHAGSIYLDGSSDVYINDINKWQLKPFNFTDNYTIEAWVKPLNSSATPSIFDTRKKAVSAVIGAPYNGLGARFKGYITGVKTSKGISRYSSNFTVDMIPAVSDDNTSLLLNFRKAGVIDSLSKNNISTVGTAAVSLEEKKYGAGSISFDGGGYLAIPEANHFLVESGNFTIEWNMFVTNTSSNYGVFATCAPDVSSNGHLYITFKNNELCVGTYGGSVITFPTCSGTLGEWQHIAVARNSGSCLVFKNGILQDTKEFSTNITVQSGAYIGKTFNAAMSGYIDEFRFTKGVCRYTSNFDPNNSLSLLYDAAGTQYTPDTSTTILNPPRYPVDNAKIILNEYLLNNQNRIMIDYILVGGGGGGGSAKYAALTSFGGGGGGAEFKSGNFLAQRTPLNISIGAGGTAVNGFASTGGNHSSIQGYIDIISIGGGAGGSCGTGTVSTFFYATSGACGGGSFQFTTGVPQNSGGFGVYFSGITSTLTGYGGMGAGYSSSGNNPFVLPFATYKNNATVQVNGGGMGISTSWPIYLSSFCGGGMGGTAAAGSSDSVSNNAWGGGGWKRSEAPGSASHYGYPGLPGGVNTGGGGGGAGSSNGAAQPGWQIGGAGGSGCAIFRVPAVLIESFQAFGSVEKIIVDNNAYIIFKGSGTLQLI